jgi:hypothetical protein
MDTSKTNLFKKILNCEYEIPSGMSKSSVELIKTMLVADPMKRTTIDKIKISKWVTDEYITPPNSYIPPRPPLQHPLDDAIIKSMARFGFDPLTVGDIITNEPDSTAFSIYYLIKERNDVYVSNTIKYSSHGNHFSAPNSKVFSKPDLVRRTTGTSSIYKKEVSAREHSSSDQSGREKSEESDNGTHDQRLRSAHDVSKSRRLSNTSYSIRQQAQAHARPSSITAASQSSVSFSESVREYSIPNNPPIVRTRGKRKSFIEKLVGNLFAPASQVRNDGLPREISKVKEATIHSIKSVREIHDEIMRVLNAIGVTPDKITQISSFCYECDISDMRFKIEICRLKETNIHVLEFKRVSGSRNTYKIIGESVKKCIKL